MRAVSAGGGRARARAGVSTACSGQMGCLAACELRTDPPAAPSWRPRRSSFRGSGDTPQSCGRMGPQITGASAQPRTGVCLGASSDRRHLRRQPHSFGCPIPVKIATCDLRRDPTAALGMGRGRVLPGAPGVQARSCGSIHPHLTRTATQTPTRWGYPRARPGGARHPDPVGIPASRAARRGPATPTHATPTHANPSLNGRRRRTERQSRPASL